METASEIPVSTSFWWPATTPARIALVVFTVILFIAGTLMGTGATIRRPGVDPFSVPLSVHFAVLAPADLLQGLGIAATWWAIIMALRWFTSPAGGKWLDKLAEPEPPGPPVPKWPGPSVPNWVSTIVILSTVLAVIAFFVWLLSLTS